VSPSPAVPKTGLDLARASACTACHGVTEEVLGPPFRDVAARYAGDSAAESRLVAKVRAGGSGSWGTVPMPAQAQLKDATVRALVQWILGGAK
jgi:cytochrome c551/c552